MRCSIVGVAVKVEMRCRSMIRTTRCVEALQHDQTVTVEQAHQRREAVGVHRRRDEDRLRAGTGVQVSMKGAMVSGS